MGAKQLVQKIVAEGSDSRYQTDVNDVTVDGLGENLSVDDGSATVTWDLLFESRSWGVKDLDAAIQRVEVHASVDDLSAENPPKTEYNLVWAVEQPAGWSVQVDHRSQGRFPLSFYPTGVELSVPKKLITIIF